VKPRTLLVLVVLVLGLGAYIGFYDRNRPSTEEREKAGDKVVEVAKDDVQAVEIDRNGQVVRLERVGKAADGKKAADTSPATPASPALPAEPTAEWRLTRPSAARADAQAVSGLVDALVGLAKTRTLERPDRKGVGLDHPQAVVRLTTAGGTRELEIGAKIPTGSELVVGVKGDRDAYVTSDAILSTLQREPGEWRDRQMLGADRDRIDRVTLTGPAGTTVLARKGEGFEIASPAADHDRADRDLIEGLLTDLTGLRAQQFVDDPKTSPATLGLAPPRATVEVATKGAAPARIEIGGPAPAPPANPANPAAPPPPGPEGASPASPSVYARVGSQAITAQTGLAADAARAPADWRSRALSAFQVYQVESVQLQDAAGTVTVDRGTGSDWKRGRDTIPYTPVSDLLFAVVGGKASRVLAAAEAKAQGLALGKPIATVVLKAEKGGGQETVTFYPPTATAGIGAAVRTSGRDVILLLPSDKLAEIEKQIAAIRNVQPVAPEKPEKPGKPGKK
jgi:hypothetical protein